MSTQIQNFYEATLTRNWTATTGDFNVSVAPTISEGIIVISPSSRTLREIVRFTATGTNAYGPFVRVSNIAHRGLGGTTAQVHTIGEKVRMNITAEHWTEMQDDIDSIVAAGLPSGSLGDIIYNNGTNWIPSNLDSLLDTYTENKVQTATVTLSSADILALNTTPVQLLPAPGVGKINVVENIVALMNTGGTAYLLGGNINIRYNGGSNLLIPYFDPALIRNASYKYQLRVASESSGGTGTRLEEGENKAVEIYTGTAFTTGNGTLKIIIKYRIITL